MIGAIVVALFFWAMVFAVFFTAQGTSPLEYLLGSHEPLPDDLGVWRAAGASDAARHVREERLLLPPEGEKADHLLHQVRHRDRITGEVVSVGPETRVRRRRIRR